MSIEHHSGSKLTRRFAMLVTALSAILLVALPATASAGSSIYVDIPGFSIGFHDSHYKKKRYRRVYRDNYYHRHYHNGHHSRKYERRSRRYYNRRHYDNRYRNNRYYNNPHYNDNYYYGGHSNRYNRNRYYNDRRYNNRRSQVCPLDGYSPYYNDNLRCYRHKDHFHCS